jgi:anti-sigma B factor antagonist
MTVTTEANKLVVQGLHRLSAANAEEFKELLRSQLTEASQFVEIDCTTICFVDSTGLGALISVHKWLSPRGGKVRLLSPLPVVRQLLRLLLLDQIFEITH